MTARDRVLGKLQRWLRVEDVDHEVLWHPSEDVAQDALHLVRRAGALPEHVRYPYAAELLREVRGQLLAERRALRAARAEAETLRRDLGDLRARHGRLYSMSARSHRGLMELEGVALVVRDAVSGAEVARVRLPSAMVSRHAGTISAMCRGSAEMAWCEMEGEADVDGVES